MWLSPFSDVIGCFEQRSPTTADGKSMKLQTLTFPVAVANDSACNFVEETSRSLNLSDGMFGIPLFLYRFVVVSLRGLNLLCFFSASSPASCMFLISDQRNVFSFAFPFLFARRLIDDDGEIPSGPETTAWNTFAFRLPKQQRSIEIVFWLNLNGRRRLIRVS